MYATSLYSFPVSKYAYANSLDKSYARVPFPDAAVPSTAIIIFFIIFIF